MLQCHPFTTWGGPNKVKGRSGQAGNANIKIESHHPSGKLIGAGLGKMHNSGTPEGFDHVSSRTRKAWGERKGERERGRER